MKTLALAIFAFAATHASRADTVGKHYDLSKVVALIAVDEHGNHTRDSQYFEPMKTQFTEPAEVSKLCKKIGESAVEDGAGPFAGHLCHFVMLDKDQKLLGMVSILNYNCRCDIYAAHRDAKGRIVADYDKMGFGFTSREVARAFYDRLTKDDGAYMKKMDVGYAKYGKTVEGLLFGTEDGKPK